MYRTKKLGVASIVAVAAAGLLALAPTAAFADDVDNDPGKLAEVQVLPEGPLSSTYTVPLPEPGVVYPFATVWGTGTLAASGTTNITPPGGSTGGLRASFSSPVAAYNSGTFFQVHGTSQGIWLGSSPFNASSITLTDTLWAGGISPTVSAGPVGAGFYTDGATFTYSTSLNNAYVLNHSYTGLEFSGLIFTINERSQVQAVFGGSSFLQITN